MDFLNWWFESHSFLATWLSPLPTVLWACYTGQTAWAILAGVWYVSAVMIRVAIDRKGR